MPCWCVVVLTKKNCFKECWTIRIKILDHIVVPMGYNWEPTEEGPAYPIVAVDGEVMPGPQAVIWLAIPFTNLFWGG